MLKSLYISNYALIESLEINFPEGLIIITGETGAGKSILLGALSLLLGAKAETGVFKNQNQNCIVEADFLIEKNNEIEELFIRDDIEFEEKLTIRRIISPGGKSRSFVNDNPVSVQFLKDLSVQIIDIHSQHQHLLLADNNFQLSVLDAWCGNSHLLDEYKATYNNYNLLTAKYKEINELLVKSTAEWDYNNYVLKQLQDAKLIEGELEQLEEEFNFLSNAGEIRSSLEGVITLLNPVEGSIVQNLKDAINLLTKIENKFHFVKEVSTRLESCRIELKDIEREITTKSEQISLSPDRLNEIEQRISLIYSLLKRHKCEDVAALIFIREELLNKEDDLERVREELNSIQSRLVEIEKTRNLLSDQLHNRRISEANKFASIIQINIRELEMPHAEFFAEIKENSGYGPFGRDSVQFLFSANKNIAARELSKVASGGEVSRIMLCLKALNAKNIGMPSMIFDEIDAGVSGSIADKMGNLLDDLSKNLQIFAITHLPQIASKGNTHLLVYKDIDEKNITNTHIKEIERFEREKEIARMLSGSELTKAAFENAKVLLKSK